MGLVELHYREDGPPDAPVLVLGNSLGSTLAIWDALLPALSARFRVLRFDYRGHGGSPVPPGPYDMEQLGGDLLALLDKLKIARAHYCGISLGGALGMWLAQHAAERIERLALICTSARFAPKQMWHERAALVRREGAGAFAEAVVGRWLTPEFAAREPALVAQLRAMVAATPAEGYAGCCEAIAGWDGLDLLPRIAAPTLVVASERDVGTPPPHAQLIGAAVPGARVVIVDAAHVPIIERPAELSALLLAHLSGDAPAVTLAEERALAARGERIRREVLGDAHVDRAQQNTSAFTAPFQQLITRYPWGSVWSRPGLTRAERSIATLTALAILHHEEELGMHVRAALRNGLSVRQLQEVLLHVGVYAGVPVANRAFAVAQRALQEAGIAEALTPPPPEST